MGNDAWLPSGYYDPADYCVYLHSEKLNNIQSLETVIHEIVHAISEILGKGNGGGYSKDARAVF